MICHSFKNFLFMGIQQRSFGCLRLIAGDWERKQRNSADVEFQINVFENVSPRGL